MRLAQETAGELLTFRLEGQLMGGPDAEAVRSALLAAIEQGTKKILVDMSAVTWVNSTGLGILISSHMSARERGGSVKLFGLSKRIESILNVTRLNTVFDVLHTEEDARRSFPASPGRPA